MKSPSPRQREILAVLNQKGFVAVEEICRVADISQASAYREIQALIRMGLAVKIPGGIGQVEQPLSGCLQCGRAASARLAFFIERKEAAQQVACCAHCGLLALAEGADVQSAMTSDFLYGVLLPARQAWYVLDSSVSPCCRPSVLCFSDQRSAGQFAQGFGGRVVDFAGAVAGLRALMNFYQP